jgi:hypothetical protein
MFGEKAGAARFFTKHLKKHASSRRLRGLQRDFREALHSV